LLTAGVNPAAHIFTRTAAEYQRHVLNSQLINQEAVEVGALLDFLIERGADTVTGAGRRAQQNGAIGTVRRLQPGRYNRL
jgi:hypothetical protein